MRCPPRVLSVVTDAVNGVPAVRLATQPGPF